MRDALREEMKIVLTYRPVGIGGVSWVVVEPGLFEYPVPEGAKAALVGNKCTKCGRTFFPKRELCPDCFDEGELVDKPIDSQGVIYSSTVVSVPNPAGIKPPYAYGYVDLPADTLRIHALLEGTDPRAIAPGTKVELSIEPFAVNRQGQKIIGYKFKAVA